jgi:hypothetical protein
MDTSKKSFNEIANLLVEENDDLLNYKSQTIPAEKLHHPGPAHIDEIFINSDRNPQVLRNLSSIYKTGRLGAEPATYRIYLLTRELNTYVAARLLQIQII